MNAYTEEWIAKFPTIKGFISFFENMVDEATKTGRPLRTWINAKHAREFAIQETARYCFHGMLDDPSPHMRQVFRSVVENFMAHEEEIESYLNARYGLPEDVVCDCAHCRAKQRERN
jgi:hypothetical protein